MFLVNVICVLVRLFLEFISLLLESLILCLYRLNWFGLFIVGIVFDIRNIWFFVGCVCIVSVIILFVIWILFMIMFVVIFEFMIVFVMSGVWFNIGDIVLNRCVVYVMLVWIVVCVLLDVVFEWFMEMIVFKLFKLEIWLDVVVLGVIVIMIVIFVFLRCFIWEIVLLFIGWMRCFEWVLCCVFEIWGFLMWIFKMLIMFWVFRMVFMVCVKMFLVLVMIVGSIFVVLYWWCVVMIFWMFKLVGVELKRMFLFLLICKFMNSGEIMFENCLVDLVVLLVG